MDKVYLTRRGIMSALVASAAVGTIDIGLPQLARAQNARGLGGSKIDAALNAANASARIGAPAYS